MPLKRCAFYTSRVLLTKTPIIFCSSQDCPMTIASPLQRERAPKTKKHHKWSTSGHGGHQRYVCSKIQCRLHASLYVFYSALSSLSPLFSLSFCLSLARALFLAVLLISYLSCFDSFSLRLTCHPGLSLSVRLLLCPSFPSPLFSLFPSRRLLSD